MCLHDTKLMMVEVLRLCFKKTQCTDLRDPVSFQEGQNERKKRKTVDKGFLVLLRPSRQNVCMVH
jgi:hypothetical protein